MSHPAPATGGWLRWWRLAGRIRTSYSFLRINLFLSLPELRGRGQRERLAASVLLYRLLNDLDFDLLPWRRHRAEGLEHLRSALADGRGCLACTFHLGAYRRLAVELVLLGYAVDLVVDRRTAASLKERLAAGTGRRHRGDAGAVEERLRVLDAERHGMAEEMLAGLRGNRVVLLYLDGNTGVEEPGANERTRGNQVLVDFFARRLAVRRGVGQLAFLTGAPIVPLFAAWRGAFRPWLRCHPAIRRPTASGTTMEAFCQRVLQELFALAEMEVRARPAQFEHWLYLHRWEAASRQAASRSSAAAVSRDAIEEARASGRLLQRQAGQSLKVRLAGRRLLSCAATGALLPLDSDASRLLQLLVRPRSVDEILRHFAPQRREAAMARLLGLHAHCVIAPVGATGG